MYTRCEENPKEWRCQNAKGKGDKDFVRVERKLDSQINAVSLSNAEYHSVKYHLFFFWWEMKSFRTPRNDKCKGHCEPQRILSDYSKILLEVWVQDSCRNKALQVSVTERLERISNYC